MPRCDVENRTGFEAIGSARATGADLLHRPLAEPALHDWLTLTGAGGFVDNSAMKDRHDYRFGAAAAILMLLVPLIYPLSIGPAAAMFNAIGQPEPLGSFLEAIYAPLLELPEPFDSWVEQYMGLWCP